MSKLEVASFPGLPSFSPLFASMHYTERKPKNKKSGGDLGNEAKLGVHVTMKVEGMCLMLM